MAFFAPNIIYIDFTFCVLVAEGKKNFSYFIALEYQTQIFSESTESNRINEIQCQ